MKSSRWSLVGGVALAVIAADQLTKDWALGRLSDDSTVDLIGSLRFNLAFNTGMAFSKGSGSGAIIGLVALGIVVVLAFVARKVDSKVQLALIGVVMGGALGNIVDRLLRAPIAGGPDGFMSGAVVDFIDLQWWPIFNIADAAVVVGGITLALLGARAPVEPEPEPDTAQTDVDDDAADPRAGQATRSDADPPPS